MNAKRACIRSPIRQVPTGGNPKQALQVLDALQDAPSPDVSKKSRDYGMGSARQLDM